MAGSTVILISRNIKPDTELKISYFHLGGNESVVKKRRKDGTWTLQNKHPGLVHFDMEKTEESRRMNTLRVLRVLKYFKPEMYKSLT